MISELRNKKLEELMSKEQVVLSDLDLQLLMYDDGKREDEDHYEDKVWFKIFRNIAKRNKEEHEVMDDLSLKENDLLIMNLGENEEEIKGALQKYKKLLENSKDTIGISLDKYDIAYLIEIVTSNTPTKEENEEYEDAILESLSKNKDNSNVIEHKF